MPGIKKIKESMQKHGIPDEIMKQFDFTEYKGYQPDPVLSVIDKMDELLTTEQLLLIMSEQGCCKGGKRERDCKAFAKEHANKTVEEKLELCGNVEYMMQPKINADGTFSITLSGYQNGVHNGKTTCSCGLIKKLKQPFSVSPTYCGCCAGHFRYHYQIMLGVPVRLKAIVSSPLNTNGEKPCKFLFEIESLPTIDAISVYAPDKQIDTVNMFIELGNNTGLKCKVKYTKPKAIDLNINKSYKCVFTKGNRVIFTLGFSKKNFSLKANLYGVDTYKDKVKLSINVIEQIQNGAWNCEWYNGGTCSDKCRRGVPLTINGTTEYKCIGGAFSFSGLTDAEWSQIAQLIKMEIG